MPLPPWSGLKKLFSVGNLPPGRFIPFNNYYLFQRLFLRRFARFLPFNRAAGVFLVKAFDIEQRRAANSFTAK